MKKFIKCGLAVSLCAVLVLPTVACTTSTLDNETRTFSMAIGAIDGNFNPFFYTAANDGTVISLTQASMLSTDSTGNISCGEDEPTVVKDYTITSYDDSGKVVNQNNATADNTSYTTYSFLIKNDMKFSDGEDLTIMDVLFSLYVNIDSAYTGSATLYSNDIQGLNAYRYQDATLSDDSTNTPDFNTDAQQRITNIVNYCNNKTVSDESQVLADIETVKKLFNEEVTSDWTTADETFNSRDVDTFEYNFTEVWQYFYLMEGIIEVQTERVKNSSGSYVWQEAKNSDGTYKTTLDINTTYAEEIAEVKNDTAAIAAYTSKGYDESTAVEYVVRDYCINNVWENMTGGYTADGCTTNKTGIAQIVQYWATASTALTEFASEARTSWFEDLKNNNGGKLAVETISGVTTERVTSFDGEKLDGTYDVLNVTINDVDPKAIWNFAFTVSPMHYYSGTWEGKNYVQAALDDYAAYVDNWDNGDKTYQLTEFGLECGNSTFFSEILNDDDKNKLPVGAGPYAASSKDHTAATRETFYINKYVYYERNEYFYTMGEDIENAKIKYVVYSEMGDNDILTYLMEGEVDYGTPAATTTNRNQLATCSDYLDSSTSYYTNGYGYVGINPKYIPDETVRQVIMMAMNNNSIVKNYYGEDLADVIYRPMSKTSWAYPEDATSPYYTYTTDVDTLKTIMRNAGYSENSNGVLVNNKTGYECKITFTIAGESSDHPAYDMFCATETLLEQVGFDITVQTDSNALNKLSTGTLEVWAAAWSSAIDPDMYQVYHMDSTASSVKNWNYSEILANPTDSDWSYEYNIIVELSDIIDKARETNNQDDRAAYYADALDLVMDLAVEFPTYQRKDNEVYNKNVLKKKSLNQNVSCYTSLIDRIWEIEYV